MKTALIITYYWPPSGGAGVQRWLKFVKYLRQCDWEPILYIPENPEYPEVDHSLEGDIPDNLTILKQPIWEPYDAYKRFIGRKKDEKINAAFLSEKKQNPLLEKISVWTRGNFFIPDARKYWIKPSIKYLNQYLTEHPVDAIISTGPPHSMHLIAMQVSGKHQIPWLADFRDPWTNIDFYKDLKLTTCSDKKHRKLEKNVLKNASAVTVISNSMADDFNHIYPRKYDVITNGYDPEDIPAESPPELDKKFSIAHIGTLVSTRNPKTLWITLKKLISSQPDMANDLQIKLVGKIDHTVTNSLEKYGLTPFVKRIPYMSHDEVMICQRQSQVLLLIINNTPNAGMILTGKFFEYMAARRPILCIGPPDGDAAKILQQTHAGLLAGHDDIDTTEQHILTCYKRYKSGNLEVDSREIEQYARKKLTEQLAGLLTRIQSNG
ncbi:MAG: glycosyltransferase family 4 protein [Bacteroidetes bacterium]|nr:glycosyltransferase family 4 protein [Bacteroidota bacterium]